MENMPDVLVRFHTKRIRHYLYKHGLLLREILQLPYVSYHITGLSVDSDSSKGVIEPSSLTTPLE